MSIRPLSKTLPFLAPHIIQAKRLTKSVTTLSPDFTVEKTQDTTTFSRIVKHKSVLRRQLGTSDPQLQEQKIVNLNLGVTAFHNIIIKPGKTLSFWKQLGNPSSKKGYVKGMLISNGQVISGVGGGLCQLANLLYWMVLHTPLTVTEHHHHQVDIFPDSGRVLPFGSGASVFFNYIDLQITNTTPHTFLLKMYLDDQFLHGEILANTIPAHSYRIEERNHQFYRKPTGETFRKNELFKIEIDRKTGERTSEQLITKNDSEVLYPVDEKMFLNIS